MSGSWSATLGLDTDGCGITTQSQVANHCGRKHPAVQIQALLAGALENFDNEKRNGQLLRGRWCVCAQMVLFDVQQRTPMADLSTPFIKYVVWSADMDHVAMLSKHAIIIANKRLGQASTGAPSINFLPSCWSEDVSRLSACQDSWNAGGNQVPDYAKSSAVIMTAECQGSSSKAPVCTLSSMSLRRDAVKSHVFAFASLDCYGSLLTVPTHMAILLCLQIYLISALYILTC